MEKRQGLRSYQKKEKRIHEGVCTYGDTVCGCFTALRKRAALAAASSRLVAASLLGNVVISKKFLRTRKIMVMHSNERGECCPCTLVDLKRKR